MRMFKYDYVNVWFNWLADRTALEDKFNELGAEGFTLMNVIKGGDDNNILFIFQRVNTQGVQEAINEMIAQMQNPQQQQDEDVEPFNNSLTDEEIRKLLGDETP